MEKHIQQMVVSQCKVRLRPYKRCQLHNASNSCYRHLLAWLTDLSKFSARLSELTEPIRDLYKAESSLHLLENSSHDGTAQLHIAKTLPPPQYWHTIIQRSLPPCKLLQAVKGLSSMPPLYIRTPVYFASRALSEIQ